MAVLLRIILTVALCYVAYWLIRRAFGSPGSAAGGVSRGFRAAATANKCQTCRYAGSVFDDGTLCRYGNREVFMKPVHVSNCTDHAPRAG